MDWTLSENISSYPDDYTLTVEFSGTNVTFSNESLGMITLRYEMSVDELIKAGELAKKFKEASHEI
jgi:hypothetical protein